MKLLIEIPKTKICKKCNLSLPREDFYDNYRMGDGKEGRCKTCRNAQKKIWKKNNPEKVKSYTKTPIQKKAHKLRQRCRQYGITATQYKEMVKAQNGLCLICQKTCKQNPVLSIDHSHVTNKVRGLLCSSCNSGIAFFKDDINLIERAIKYLEAHP